MKCKFTLFVFCNLLFALLSFSQQNPVAKNIHFLPTPMHPAPIPEFSFSGLCFGDTTYFINQTSPISNPNWIITHFNGSTIDTIYISPDLNIDTNIAFKFPAIDTYSVTVTADNGHYVTLTKELKIDSVTHADFSFQGCSNKFVNMSSCASVFHWDFGDNSFSIQELPIHEYADTGNYIVTLIVSNGQNADTLTKNVHVYVHGYSNPDFSILQSFDTVFLHAYDGHIGNDYYWSFGDQAFATGRDTIHVYSDTGNYSITLLVRNACGIRSQSKNEQLFFPKFNNIDTTNMSVLIYPDPATNIQALNYAIYSIEATDSKIMVYDLLGKKVIESNKTLSKGINIGTLNISSLGSSIYTLQIDAGKKEGCYNKFLVKRN